jgi:acetoin utilization deacetylase AcuC-like enzyme
MPGRVLALTDERMMGHTGGPGHPERPERLRAVLDEFQRDPVVGVEFAIPRPATRAHIECIHDARYSDRVVSLRGRFAQLDPDTAVAPESVDAAYLAAGAAIEAVEAVVESPSPSGRGVRGEGTRASASDRRGALTPAISHRERKETTRAFALARPPGHHAERDRAMGFCLFNNIAIAAAHAIAELGCKRVLIVDWDVHHGNGTQHAFYDRSDVLVFNTHQHRLFPDTGDLDETGIGEGAGFTVNCPLPPGMDDSVYIELYRRLLVPIADHYKPDLVLVSAGFDAHRDDPLGGMNVTESGFAAMCAIVRDIADRHAGGRLALVLEGGYNLNALARSVQACVRVLAGDTAPVISDSDSARALVDQLCAVHRRYWPV